jgi:hypothetical protein
MASKRKPSELALDYERDEIVVSLRIPRDVFAERRRIEFTFNIPESTGASDQLKYALTEAEPQHSIPDRTRPPSDENPEHDEEEGLEPEIANSLA